MPFISDNSYDPDNMLGLYTSLDTPYQLSISDPPIENDSTTSLYCSDNSDLQTHHHHFRPQSLPTSSAPDLFASLQSTPSEPPLRDMRPNDPSLTPREQDLRFPGDLYTPRWIRGHGNKREGWCGLCKPDGRWLVLKNSAFWYDKSFAHGVSASTGKPFEAPKEVRRTMEEGATEAWEGLCGGCQGWIGLVGGRRRGTPWFRHAYKCHTHLKIKDKPKRRRESSRGRTSCSTTSATIAAGGIRKGSASFVAPSMSSMAGKSGPGPESGFSPLESLDEVS
ncbi:MAG: hypothetical protein M1819_006165 [Sarea resinae]|nr:MAG: hypothetical protein M1819_006165 [Sarea resinae]